MPSDVARISLGRGTGIQGRRSREPRQLRSLRFRGIAGLVVKRDEKKKTCFSTSTSTLAFFFLGQSRMSPPPPPARRRLNFRLIFPSFTKKKKWHASALKGSRQEHFVGRGSVVKRFFFFLS